jgi:arylformamidase
MARPIFLHYDRDGLDREYNNRAKVADAAAWLARYTSRSAATRTQLPARLDVAYGPHAGERLDIFPAPGPGPAPIHVFIHGGYWYRLDKADFSYVARGFRPAGVATVVINYALIPTVDMEEQIRQCRAAVAWVHRNAASFGGDPGRICVSGHSAGGHLTAMAMTTDWPARGAPPDVIASACGISGLYDLEPIRLCYLNGVLKLGPAESRSASPLRLAPTSRAPLLLTVGALEGPEYTRQTVELARAWQAHGVPCRVTRLDGHDHFSIVAELEDPTSPLTRAILGQMGLEAGLDAPSERVG